MRLLRLSCKDLASYESAVVDFEKLDYPVFVMGRTGAGKTTLFVDAITLALYGNVYGEGTKGLVKEFIRKGKNTGSVELEFEIENNRYRIERRIFEDGKSSAKLFVNNKPLITGVEAVSKELERLIGLGFKALLNSVVVRQGEVYEFIEMGGSDRRDLLQDILRINFENIQKRLDAELQRVELEIDKIEDAINRLNKEISEEADIRKKLETAREELPKIKLEIDRLERERTELNEEKDRYLTRLGEIKSEIGELEMRLKDLENLKQEIDRLRKYVNSANEMLQKYPKEVLENLGELKTKIIETYDLKRKIEDHRKRVDEYGRRLQSFKRMVEIRTKLEEEENIQQEYRMLQEEFRELQFRKSDFEARLIDVDRNLKILESAETCPVCGSLLPQERRRDRIRHLEDERNRIQEELRRIKDRLAELESERRKLEEKKDEIAELKGTCAELERSLGGQIPSESEYKSLLESLTKLEEDKKARQEYILTSLGVDVDKVEMNKLLNELDNLISALRDREHASNLLKPKEKQLEVLESYVSRRTELINERDQLQNKIKKLTTRIEELNKNIQELVYKRGKLEDSIKKYEEDLKRIAEKKKELDSLRQQLADLQTDMRACELLKSRVFSPGALPAELLREYLEFIEERANEYLEIFGQNIRIKLNVSESRGTKSVELSAYMDGYRRDIKTFSGGERTLIGFAIRLAIGELITRIFSIVRKPKFLIIDEGFGMLDAENRGLVADAIARLHEEGIYEQIIVISHQQDLREHSAFRTIIEVSKDAQNVSKAYITHSETSL